VPTLIVRPVSTTWTRLLSLILSLAVVLFAVAPAMAATIQTDLWVYQQGDTVNVSGDGFGPEENVQIVTTDPNGVVVDDGSVVSDLDGIVGYSFVLTSDVPGIYDIVATGLSSGLTASTQFDPASVSLANVSPFQWYRDAGSGFTLTVNGNYTCTSSGNPSCTSPTDIVVELRRTDSSNATAAGAVIASRTLTGLTDDTANVTWGPQAFAFPAQFSDSAYNGMVDVKVTFNYSGVSSPQVAIRDNQFGIDNESPTSSVDPISDQLTGSAFTVTGLASDGASGIASGGVLVTLRRTSPPVATVASANRNASGGTWTWNPGAQSVAGTYCVDSLATDVAGNVQGAADTECFSVLGANSPPTANDDSPSVVEDSVDNLINVLSNDTDPNVGDTLSVTAVSSPTDHGTTSLISGVVRYTPTANYCGSDSFTYDISDGNGGTDQGTVNVAVSCVNDAPVADDETVSATEDTALDTPVSTLLAGDTDADLDPLSVSAVSGALGGSAVLMDNGTLLNKADDFVRFSPDANLCGLAAGSYDYTVSDGGLTDSGHVTVDISCVNDAPVVVISGTFTAVDEGVTRPYTYTVTDIDSGSSTVTESCTGDATYIADGAANSFQCKFTDGPGSGTVNVTADDHDVSNNIGDDPHVVTVNNVAPTVTFDITNDYDVNEGATGVVYTFTIHDPGVDTVIGIGTSCGVGGFPVPGSDSWLGNSGTFACDFPDGPATPVLLASATDSDNATGDFTNQAVTVNNVAPSIAISGAASVNEGSPYSLTLGAVTDPGADTVSSYVVHWGDGNSDTYSANGVVTHTYADGPNSYNITVDLVDEDGTFLNRANAKAVTVNNVKPTPVIDSFTGAGGTACLAGNTVTLGFSWSDPAGAADTYSYDVDWGDSSLHATGSNVFSPISGLTHVYAPGGPYIVTVKVNDDDPGLPGSVSSSGLGFSFHYDTSGILQPINLTGPRSSFKIGSTIPVKLRVTDCSGLSVSGLVLTVHLQKIDSGAESVNEVVVVSNADTGVFMRYDASATQYIYNLSTKRSQFFDSQDLTNGTYHVWITGPTISQVNAYFDAKK
jgi:hypothetical protein